MLVRTSKCPLQKRRKGYVCAVRCFISAYPFYSPYHCEPLVFLFSRRCCQPMQLAMSCRHLRLSLLTVVATSFSCRVILGATHAKNELLPDKVACITGGRNLPTCQGDAFNLHHSVPRRQNRLAFHLRRQLSLLLRCSAIQPLLQLAMAVSANRNRCDSRSPCDLLSRLTTQLRKIFSAISSGSTVLAKSSAPPLRGTGAIVYERFARRSTSECG